MVCKNLLANSVLENQDPNMIAISVDQDQDETCEIRAYDDITCDHDTATI